MPAPTVPPTPTPTDAVKTLAIIDDAFSAVKDMSSALTKSPSLANALVEPLIKFVAPAPRR